MANCSYLAWPALGSAATCTVSPANPTINMGQNVSWTNTRSGFPSGTYTYAWTFPGGNPSSSTSSSRSVSYANAGTSTTSLRVTRGGTSATSGGGLWIPYNRLMRAAGMQDSAEEAMQYLLALTAEDVAPEVVVGAPGLRHEHEHRMGQAAPAGREQFEHVVEAG